ncbi:hypothetical protein ACFX1S_036576 [Malus domestica]
MVVSSHYTENFKAGQLVDKSTDKLGYKQDAKFTSTERYVNKELRFTTKYQTQVKFKKSVYPTSLDLHHPSPTTMTTRIATPFWEIDENIVRY